jgi:hypothetical protein
VAFCAALATRQTTNPARKMILGTGAPTVRAVRHPRSSQGFGKHSLLSASSHFVDLQDPLDEGGRHVAGQVFWAATIRSSLLGGKGLLHSTGRQLVVVGNVSDQGPDLGE